MDFAEIRRVVITALFSDDMLLDRLVLKGGNALSLIYGLTSRTSMDLDFSMADDFEDLADAEGRMFAALRDRFDSKGYVVFDEKLEVRPNLKGEDSKPWWGGYELRFKLIERVKYQALRGDQSKLQREAFVTGTKQKQERTFTVDLSKCEYTEGKVEHQLDHYAIWVYTLEMIAVEKLRAICQQMPAYDHRGKRKARARDFYDICQIVSQCRFKLSSEENLALARHIFEAKQVPLTLLSKIEDQREFHRQDWPAVVATAGESLQAFDFYFDFVLEEVSRMESLWVEDPPV